MQDTSHRHMTNFNRWEHAGSSGRNHCTTEKHRLVVRVCWNQYWAPCPIVRANYSMESQEVLFDKKILIVISQHPLC